MNTHSTKLTNEKQDAPDLSIDKGVVPMIIIGMMFGILIIKNLLFKSYNYGSK